MHFPLRGRLTFIERRSITLIPKPTLIKPIQKILKCIRDSFSCY